MSSRGDDPPPAQTADGDSSVLTGKKAAKGYAWVEEVVPSGQAQGSRPANGHTDDDAGHANGANGGDAPIEVDDEESARASSEAGEARAASNGPNDPIIVD